MIWYVPNNPCDDIDIYIYISAWTSFFVGGWPTKLETETQRSTKSKLFFEVTCQEVFVWGVDCLGEDLKNNNDAHISWMSLGFIDELWGDVQEAKNHWGLQRNQWDIYQITGQSNKPWDVPSFFWLPVWSLQTVCWCTLATGNFRKTPPMSQCQGICIDIYFWITWGSIIYIFIARFQSLRSCTCSGFGFDSGIFTTLQLLFHCCSNNTLVLGGLATRNK